MAVETMGASDLSELRAVHGVMAGLSVRIGTLVHREILLPQPEISSGMLYKISGNPFLCKTIDKRCNEYRTPSFKIYIVCGEP